MASSTLKTVVGFLISVIERHTPLRLHGDRIEDIYNHLQINDSLATSGQPTERQFELIRDAGYRTVINLAPSSVLGNSLNDEGTLLAGLGIAYVHIPVDLSLIHI